MDRRYVCVTMIMSLKTFQKYCRQNDFAGQDELYVDEEATVDYGNDRTIAAHSKEHEEAEAAWKETFYETYYKKFRNMKNTTLITQEKYNRVVETIIEL
jgi:predicted patatin/cPLA2 family phospholipase